MCQAPLKNFFLQEFTFNIYFRPKIGNICNVYYAKNNIFYTKVSVHSQFCAVHDFYDSRCS